MSKILKHTSLYTLGNVLPQAAGFVLIPIYSAYMSPADYGIVSSMQVLMGVLTVFFTLAVDRSLFRLYFDQKTEKAKRDYLGSISILLIIISTAVLILLFVFQNSLSLLFKEIDFYPFFVYAILTSFFSVFSILPKIYFQLNEKAGKFVILSLLQFCFSSGFTLWFIVVKEEGAEGFLKGRMISEIVLLPLLIFIIFKLVNFNFKRNVILESLSFSLPLIPGLLSGWILDLSDRVFIERYFDLTDVGIYSIGYKIAGVVLMLTGAFYLAYNPIFYRLANSVDQESAKPQLFIYNRVYSIIVMFMVFLVSLFSKEVIHFFLDSRYQEAHKIVPLISLAYMFSVLSSLFNLMIYQVKKVKLMMYVMILGALVNIALNFIFVPIYGAYGAAYATVLSFILIFIVSYFYAKRCYFIPLPLKELGLILISGFSVVWLFNQFDFNILFSLILKLVLVAFLSVVVVFKFRSDIMAWFKKKI